jgi:hypothetical protein
LIKIGPSIPPLTTKQCKIFSFLCLVESEKSFSNVIEKFMDYLEYKLFSKDTNRNRNRNRSRISTYSIFGLANISRIFVTFCKYKGENRIQYTSESQTIRHSNGHLSDTF